MKKLEYFLLGFKHGSFMYKEWIIDCFGQVVLDEVPSNPNFQKTKKNETETFALAGVRDDKKPVRYVFEKYPLQLFEQDNKVWFFHPDTQEQLELEGVTIGKPFYSFKEEVQLKKGDMVNLDRDVTTWIGNMITNQIILVYPFGDIIPFITGRFFPKDAEKKIQPLLTSITYEQKNDPTFKREPGKIYTDVLEELYFQAVFSIEGWCQLAAPAATPFTVTTDPKIKEVKDRLVKENWEAIQNGDVVVITEILNKLIAMDETFQAKDPEGGFLEVDKGKLFNIVRAKQYLMYGLEWDFNDPTKAVLIDRPLEEEWDITKLHHVANSIVSGSYNRGASTALGGELAKIIMRFFLNTTITEDDCKTNRGFTSILRAADLAGYEDVYYRSENKWVLTNTDTLKKLIGQKVEFRSPMFCLTKGDGYCLHCMGLKYRNLKNSLASLATEAGNIIMYIFMKRMHGVSLAIVDWDINTELF